MASTMNAKSTIEDFTRQLIDAAHRADWESLSQIDQSCHETINTILLAATDEEKASLYDSLLKLKETYEQTIAQCGLVQKESMNEFTKIKNGKSAIKSYLS